MDAYGLAQAVYAALNELAQLTPIQDTTIIEVEWVEHYLQPVFILRIFAKKHHHYESLIEVDRMVFLEEFV